MKDLYTDSINRRFSAAADYYELLATVQRQVAEELMVFLPSPSNISHILEVGCGTGIMTRLLLKRYPQAHVLALDISEKMIDKAKEQIQNTTSVTWQVADAMNFNPPRLYPLIVSNCALHWLREPAAGIHRLARALAPNGIFSFAIMLDGTLGELHACRKKVAPHKPPLREMPRPSQVLAWVHCAKLRLVACHITEYRLEYRSAAALLNAIHKQGLTGGPFSRSSSPLTRGELIRLMAQYNDQFATAQGYVYATYKVFFLCSIAPITPETGL